MSPRESRVEARLRVSEKVRIMLYLRVNPESAELENGFSRDVREIGHWGTGELELTIKNIAAFEKAKKYIDMTYTFNLHKENSDI